LRIGRNAVNAIQTQSDPLDGEAHRVSRPSSPVVAPLGVLRGVAASLVSAGGANRPEAESASALRPWALGSSGIAWRGSEPLQPHAATIIRIIVIVSNNAVGADFLEPGFREFEEELCRTDFVMVMVVNTNKLPLRNQTQPNPSIPRFALAHPSSVTGPY